MSFEYRGWEISKYLEIGSHPMFYSRGSFETFKNAELLFYRWEDKNGKKYHQT